MEQYLVGVVMGSKSDWSTMSFTVNTLKSLNISCHAQIISAHRTPDLLFNYASSAENNGVRVIIAGAGGAAHLPGMLASKTHIPILGVPIKTDTFSGNDSLLSIVQMPAGVPVATFAIGRAGAINAALFSCSLLAISCDKAKRAIKEYRMKQTQRVLSELYLN